ncbi:MAG: alpha/beta hydrolase [Gemmatimonadota bacterium]|jgi:pimeloyl-ACP methyl ester carboxylesterase
MRMLSGRTLTALLCLLALSAVGGRGAEAQEDILNAVEDHYVDNGDVTIHYVSMGEGPLVVFIHGFPDFWYSWRDQMEGLKDRFRVVAIDQRGYNLSDAPEGVAAYAMGNLIGDVASVIHDAGAESATVVGHDWGGAVAWQVAFALPQMVDHLVILNLPHPSAMAREMMINVEQRRNSAYARAFQEGSPDDPDIFFGGPMTPQTLAGWVTDEAARARYVEAFERSNFEGMLNYYKANYPALPEPGQEVRMPEVPQIQVPVLQFHGLDDTALNSDGLNNTWDWIDADYTLVTVPGAGHFVQQDASELVTSTLRSWLLARQ